MAIVKKSPDERVFNPKKYAITIVVAIDKTLSIKITDSESFR